LTLAGSLTVAAQSGPPPTPPPPPPNPAQLLLPTSVTDANKDQVAWDLFINAVVSAGIPNVQAAYFETWADDAESFAVNPTWPTLQNGRLPAKKLQPSLLRSALIGTHGVRGVLPQVPSPGTGGCVAPNGPPDFAFPTNGCIGEEVRRNWPSFWFIAHVYQTGMNTQAHMATLYQYITKYGSQYALQFPANAVDVKADWIPVQYLMTWLNTVTGQTWTTQQIEQNYYTNIDNASNPPIEYALVAFHVASKLTPNWVWATFEHQLNPGRCDTMGCLDAFGAQQAAVSPNLTAANTEYGTCAKTQALSTLMSQQQLAPQWSNYCLKATQINFTNPPSRISPILNGNSVTERINAGVPIEQASCITCHAYASFLSNGSANKQGLANNLIGAVNTSLLANSQQSDFMWGILGAPAGGGGARTK
jgi:hypothetical protein